MDNEEYYAIYGLKIGKFFCGFGQFYTNGTPSRVSFDYQKIIDNQKGFLGFYHTHPNMINYPSMIDEATMENWCDTLGKELLCFIDGVNGLSLYICNSNQKSIDMLRQTSNIKKYGNFFLGKIESDESIMMVSG